MPSATEMAGLGHVRHDRPALQIGEILSKQHQALMLLSCPMVFFPDKEPVSYHGPTSTVLDEKSTAAGNVHKTGLNAKVPEVWVERQLVAESVLQQQLETVNRLAGSLDFDGNDADLAMHLLPIYWNRQHTSTPIVYRTAFMRDMACGGPYLSKLLLNAINFYASEYTSRPEVCRDPNNRLSAGWKYRQRAIQLLSQSFDKSNITTIQALLITSSALFSYCIWDFFPPPRIVTFPCRQY